MILKWHFESIKFAVCHAVVFDVCIEDYSKSHTISIATYAKRFIVTFAGKNNIIYILSVDVIFTA